MNAQTKGAVSAGLGLRAMQNTGRSSNYTLADYDRMQMSEYITKMHELIESEHARIPEDLLKALRTL